MVVFKGKRRSLRLFVYKFANIIRCSAASASDFNLVDTTEQLITPPIRMTRNVAWSFFSLDVRPDYDLDKDFVSKDQAHLSGEYFTMSRVNQSA